MIAESLSPRNGGNVGLLLGAGVAMECSIGFHFLSMENSHSHKTSGFWTGCNFTLGPHEGAHRTSAEWNEWRSMEQYP